MTQIAITCDPDYKRELKKIAKSKGFATMSAYIRHLVANDKRGDK